MMPRVKPTDCLSLLLLACLAAAAPRAVAQAPAAARVAEVEAQLERARASLDAAQRRVAELEKALAEAQRDVIRETVERTRAGDGEALRQVLDAQKSGSIVVDAVWAGAVRGDGVDHAKIVRAIGAEWQKAPTRQRCKLCWLLGEGASAEAAAFLRGVLAREADASVLGAAIAALRRCPRSAEDLPAVRRHAGDQRAIAEAIGYYPAGKLADLATRFVAELEKQGQAAAPAEIVVEPPTLHCLGFEWHIEGDSNHSCTVAVHYRAKGQRGWQRGAPLVRCENRAHPLYEAHPGNLLAGSIFDLEPGTEYEVRLVLSDPDGGSAEQTVTARTRGVPSPWEKGRVLHVVPGGGGGTGTADDPLRGLAAADAVARPGDVFVLAAGRYQGGLRLKKSGEPGKPIVYRGVDAGRTVIDGQKGDTALEASRLGHLHFEKLTFTNARIALAATASEGLVVRGCRFVDFRVIGIWVVANGGVNSRNAHVADNVIVGQAEWPRGRRQSTYGILISGEGHVVCHNRIENHWDGISLSSNKGQSRPPTRAVDIYANDIRQCVDDGVEADYVHHNVRIFRNRLVNTFSSLSCQPGFGGPVYMLHNLLFNTTNKPFKLHLDPTGLVIAHNTCLTTREAFYGGNFHNALLRNNLILGLPGEQGYWLSTQASQLDMDYSGHNDPGTRPLVKLNNLRYHDLAALAAATGLEKHRVQLDWDTFVRTRPPPGQGVTADPAGFDLRLRPSSRAVDAGTPLPGINDGFAGEAPDLGCYELGKPVPAYGPRR